MQRTCQPYTFARAPTLLWRLLGFCFNCCLFLLQIIFARALTTTTMKIKIGNMTMYFQCFAMMKQWFQLFSIRSNRFFVECVRHWCQSNRFQSQCIVNHHFSFSAIVISRVSHLTRHRAQRCFFFSPFHLSFYLDFFLNNTFPCTQKRLHLTNVQFTKYAYSLSLRLLTLFELFSLCTLFHRNISYFRRLFSSLYFIYDVGGLDTKSHLMGSMHSVFKLLAINSIQSDSFTFSFSITFSASTNKMAQPLATTQMLKHFHSLLLSMFPLCAGSYSFSFVHWIVLR